MSVKSSAPASSEIAKSASGGFYQKIVQLLFGTWENTQLTISAVLVILIAIAPAFTNSPYWLGILVLTVIYAYIGISWNIVSGLTGQLLIAHIIFIAFGGYTTIVLLNTYSISPWIGLLAGGVVAALAGVVISFITLRYGLKMDYFALFTIALLVALRTLFLKWDYVGGAVGMWVKLKNPSLLKMVFADKSPYLYIALGLLVIGIILQYLIYRSKMGKYFMAIREDEDAAAALGVNTSLYKTISVVVSAAMAGVGGGLYMMYVTFIDPTGMFNLGMNVEIVMAGPIIGGLGSLVGPILGGLVNKPIAELIRGYLAESTSGISLIVYGLFLITSIMFMPRGLAGLLHTLYQKLTRSAGER